MPPLSSIPSLISVPAKVEPMPQDPEEKTFMTADLFPLWHEGPSAEVSWGKLHLIIAEPAAEAICHVAFGETYESALHATLYPEKVVVSVIATTGNPNCAYRLRIPLFLQEVNLPEQDFHILAAGLYDIFKRMGNKLDVPQYYLEDMDKLTA